MPNHCEQDLRISCDKKDIKELKEFVKFAKKGKDLLSDEKFIPYPKERKEMIKKFNNSKKLKERWGNGSDYWFNNGGHEWCKKNWGTKWGIYESELVEENYACWEVMYSFNSAWCPAKPIIMAMSKKFPNLTFDLTYFEQGCMLNGWYRLKAGEVTNDEEGKYFGNRGG